MWPFNRPPPKCHFRSWEWHQEFDAFTLWRKETLARLDELKIKVEALGIKVDALSAKVNNG